MNARRYRFDNYTTEIGPPKNERNVSHTVELPNRTMPMKVKSAMGVTVMASRRVATTFMSFITSKFTQ